jgi:hypothetical protein
MFLYADTLIKMLLANPHVGSEYLRQRIQDPASLRYLDDMGDDIPDAESPTLIAPSRSAPSIPIQSFQPQPVYQLATRPASRYPVDTPPPVPRPEPGTRRAGVHAVSFDEPN